MNPLLDVYLEAHHAERNVHRWYHIHLSRDLFGEYLLTLGYGRVGRCGQQQRFSSPEQEPLHRIIRQRLQRRSNSPSRIQCAYRVVECELNPAMLDSADGRPRWLTDLKRDDARFYSQLATSRLGCAIMQVRWVPHRLSVAAHFSRRVSVASF